VNQYSVGGLPLTAMARQCVAVVKMRMLPGAESHLTSRVHLKLQITVLVDLFYRAQLAV
jgi:hypothetical protein